MSPTEIAAPRIRLRFVGEVEAGTRVNVFIHGYRSLASSEAVGRAARRVLAAGAVGENYLLDWDSGGWRRSFRANAATLAGLRAAYRVARLRHVLAPWMILVDAGVVSLAEVAQFKFMERRAERVGAELGPLVQAVADGRPVNLIGHSLGARVIHHALRRCSSGVPSDGPTAGAAIEDCVLLAGAADLGAADWRDCLRSISGRLYNAYSPRDRILRITPDLRRRVGGGPMPQVVINDAERVVNHRCEEVGHTTYWTEIDRLLPRVWPGCQVAGG
ncbi:MAG: DUF726 domain-containing protein [Planctomycetota bacterium]